MNNDIKEIREYIACPQFGDDHYGKWGALRLDQRQKIKQLLDYITNLQIIEQQYSAILSENAELENKITNLQEEIQRQEKAQVILDNELAELIDYKNRIDKAVEYIDNCIFDYEENSMTGQDFVITKNILQGSDKE